MEDRSATATTPKPATTSSPVQSTTTDIKSPTSSRPLYSSKLGDHRGKDASAAQTARQASAQQQKAWTSTSKNPLTGRSQNQQNSFNSQSRNSVTSSLREGQRVRITLVSGAEFEGTYYNNGSDSSSCRLSQVFQKKLPNSAEIANGANRREQNQMTIQRKDIMDARVISGNAGRNDGKGANGNRSSFKTDASISNSRLGAGRALEPWAPPPETDPGFDGSLEKPGTAVKWDQFATNERLFGLTTDYSDDIYTTPLNKNHPQYKDRVAVADRKVREIEGSAPTTAHVAEERVMDFVGVDDTRDEEDKYSGVRRQADFPPLTTNRENKYTPPARRAPTGSATVKGAPVDPAIISSQLKGAPASKQPSPKPAELKVPAVTEKPSVPVPTVPAASKSGDSKPESKPVESKPAEAAPVAAKPTDANTAAARPSAANRGALSAKSGDPASKNVEVEVLKQFKAFATHERQLTEKARTVKAKVDKEIKLTELKKFSDSFKLSTPVPSDLISIIAKDPAKQQAIQEKAMRNAAEIARAKAAEAAVKEKETATASTVKETQAKVTPPADQSNSSTPAPASENRVNTRPTAPQHSSSSGTSGRHTGPRNSYNAQSHYQYGRGNRPPPHLATPNQATGQLSQRLRNVEQQKMQHPHMVQHVPQDMRLPPTGPANPIDPNYGRRISGAPLAFMGPKTLNPNSHEFRPSAFAQPFNPAVAPLNPIIPSQGSSPRSSVNNIIEAPVVPPVPVPPPAKGQLVRRKTKSVDVTKCYILSHIETWQPPPGRRVDDNDGLRPSYDTPPTWRQLQEETEAKESTMHLTYNEYFDKIPRPNAAVATPNPTHAIPQAHQHQLPFHLQQHGAQAMAPRQSPHMPPMPMQPGQHGHVPHVQYNPDDHRMMHSTSAQSFASPRMGQVPMAYPANTPGQMPYGQPMMQHYVNPGAPPMGQFRSFSNNGQFMQQQPHHMGTPMQVFVPPNGMVATGPMYPGGHPQFIPPGPVPPQPMAGSNGFPSPGRPTAPMMAHQGSHQGQPAVYMSPAMPYQQVAYTPQQPQGKFSGPRPQ
ncbi:PAB1-binding protein 1 [Podospora australis]|uniref:PAB1-binding protein 1 n=1 Tax=Podospora australis TaxID=1536484 RepID=A0AAN7AHQ2_9PEZI|nr:PAB1-binding protein 1 [Podospora australis]